MPLVFPDRWDLDDNPEVVELLHLQPQDFAFLNKSSTLAMDADRYNPEPLARRRVRAAFRAVFYLVALRRQAALTQHALEISSRAELDDSLDMYIPVLTSWFNTVFANYFRSILSDAVTESFIFDVSATNPCIPIFRMRFSVFLRLLCASVAPPSPLLHFWPRLAGPRLYLPDSLAAVLASAGPVRVDLFSGSHESLAGFVVLFRSLVEAVLLRKYLSLLKQRDTVDSALSRAASHFRLLASLVAGIFLDEFLPEGGTMWSPHFFPIEEVRKFLLVLGETTVVAHSSSVVVSAVVSSPRGAVKVDIWSTRVSESEICAPIKTASVELRRFIGNLIRNPLIATTRATPGATTEEQEEETIDTGKGRYVVVERDGAEVYAEPTTFNAPISRLNLGVVVEVEEAARGGLWLRLVGGGGWIYGKTRFTGEPTMGRMHKIESEIYFVKERIPLYTGPFVHSKLKKGEWVEKFTVIEVDEAVRVDHSSVFGLKFLKLPQGWLADKDHVVPARVKERGVTMYKSSSFQTIRPWTAPDWKSKKKDVEVVSAMVFEVDLAIEREDGSVWVRMLKDYAWLPLKHTKITSPVISKCT